MTNAPEKEVEKGAEATVPEAVTDVASDDQSEALVDDSGDADIVADEGEGADGEISVLDALEAKVAELEKEKKDTYERLLRATADLDNFRKRSRREIEDARVETRSRALREILPVIDNLDRAMTHAKEGSAEGILDGVKLVMRQFEQALGKFDVKAIDAKGKPFDPNFHEAMSQIQTPDADPGTVIEVLQQGYCIGERLLRPALVVVAKAPPAEEPAAGANGKSATASEEEPAAEASDDASTEGADEDDK